MYWVEAVWLLLGVLCELWLLSCLLFVFRQEHKSGFMQKKRTLVLLRCIKALPLKSRQQMFPSYLKRKLVKVKTKERFMLKQLLFIKWGQGQEQTIFSKISASLTRKGWH